MKKRREKRERVEWGIDRSRSNKIRVKRKGNNRHKHKDEGKLLSISYSSKERMKTKSITLDFIHRPFEGRFNPNFRP